MLCTIIRLTSAHFGCYYLVYRTAVIRNRANDPALAAVLRVPRHLRAISSSVTTTTVIPCPSLATPSRSSDPPSYSYAHPTSPTPVPDTAASGPRSDAPARCTKTSGHSAPPPAPQMSGQAACHPKVSCWVAATRAQRLPGPRSGRVLSTGVRWRRVSSGWVGAI